jgi:hypothetical protein
LLGGFHFRGQASNCRWRWHPTPLHIGGVTSACQPESVVPG